MTTHEEAFHDLEITVAGRRLFVGRSLEMARRAEQAVGALDPFARRLEKGEVTYQELQRLYTALLRGSPDAPDAETLDAWLFRVGVYAHKATAWHLMTLLIGSELLVRELERIAASSDAADAGGGAARSPFVPPAGSTGS